MSVGVSSRLRLAPTSVLLAIGYLVSILFASLVGRDAALWTGVGFLTSIFVLLTGRWRTIVVAVSLAGHVAIVVATGGDAIAAGLGVAVMLGEAMVMSWLAITYCGARRRRLSLRELVLILLGAVVPAAMMGGAVSAAALALLVHRPFFPTWRDWTLPSALGSAIVMPATLLMARVSQYRDFKRSFAEVFCLLAGLCLVTAAVFSQSWLPLNFVVFPAVTLVAFRLGPAGAAVAGFLVAVIALPLTILGYGPAMLATQLDAGGRVRLTEAVVAAALFTGLGTASALADQARLRRLVLGRDRALRNARARARRAEQAVAARPAAKPAAAAATASLRSV